MIACRMQGSLLSFVQMAKDFVMKLSQFFKREDIVRDGEFVTLDNADSCTEGTLAYCDTIHYFETANENDNVTCMIVQQEYVDRVKPQKGLVLTVNPRNEFFKLHNYLLANNVMMPQIKFGIGKNCTIHPSAVVSERTRIGNDVTIGENAVVRDYVVIGDNTFIGAGAVLGSEGLLHMVENANRFHIKHAGGVKIGSNVAILSNAVIVRAIHNTVFTTVGDHSIVGILADVGHEAQIGRNCVISGNCVIARRAQIKDGVWIGSSCVVREYVKIGAGAQVMAGSVVINDVQANQSVSGNFAMEHQKHLLHDLKIQQKKSS